MTTSELFQVASKLAEDLVSRYGVVLGIIFTLAIGLYVANLIRIAFGGDLPRDKVLRDAFLAPFEDEKPKRSLQSLTGEKPKRLIGDDGELLRPIDEFFYTEESEDGRA